MESVSDRHADGEAERVKPKLGFALTLLFVAACTFIMPVPRPKVSLYCFRAITSQRPIAIAGNSIPDHVSLCDQDKRTLPEMVESLTGKQVADYSYNGQALDESIAFSALELKNPKSKAVILPLSIPALSGFDGSDLQQYLLFRILNPTLHGESFWQRLASGAMLEGRTDPSKLAFTHDGKHFPDYNGVRTQYLENEMRKNTCPETDGFNHEFIEANYDHNYLSFAVPKDNMEQLVSLGSLAQEHRKRLLVVLMPVDYELMNSLRSGLGRSVQARGASLVSYLESHGVDVLDLTSILKDADFADRYCACGHLLDGGRTTVAARIADSLRLPARFEVH